ncbi:MAG: AMP-binding protein [Nocardioides sp.]
MTFLRPTDDALATTAALRRWLDAARPDPLLIETSGSTAAPKRVLLSRDAVLASAAATTNRLGGEGAWAVRLPTSYVAGVQTLVRSLVAGAEPISDGWQGARFTSLVPTQLLRLLESPDDVAALRDLDAVLLGGGPIDASLRERAEDAGIRIVATYGSSETAGGCVYDGYPLDGVGLIIGADGRIRLGGPTLFDGYEGDPEMTASSLVDGWFLTSDHGRLDEDGRIQVLGRLDDVIVSGGVNIPAGVVASRLREHPSVRAAEVVGADDPEWGRIVVAVVSLSRHKSTRESRPPGTNARGIDADRAQMPALDELRAWVAETHPRSWAPRKLLVLDEIPLLPNGKPDRRTLEEMAQ